MKAFVIDRYKPRDEGRIAHVPDSVPKQGQVLVRVHAAGVNVLDAKIRILIPTNVPIDLHAPSEQAP